MKKMKNFVVPQIDTNPFKGVYLDLDGVFADFDGRFFKLTGKWPHQVEKNQLWKTINRDENYFGSLELMEHAHILWDYTRQFSPIFLTGLPAKSGSKQQKEQWVAEKFGTEWEVIVLPKKEKQFHSGPTKILIDDTMVNIQQWVDKGGHGIHFKGDVKATIEEIEELRKGYGV